MSSLKKFPKMLVINITNRDVLARRLRYYDFYNFVVIIIAMKQIKDWLDWWDKNSSRTFKSTLAILENLSDDTR